MANIEIDPITGAPIIKPKEQPTVSNPIMPVVAEPTSSPGLNKPAATTPTTVVAPNPFIAPATSPVQPSSALTKVLENASLSSVTANVTADATVSDGDDKHISTVYPSIQQALREGGGDTQQQAQTFAKIKEILQDWAD